MAAPWHDRCWHEFHLSSTTNVFIIFFQEICSIWSHVHNVFAEVGLGQLRLESYVDLDNSHLALRSAYYSHCLYICPPKFTCVEHLSFPRRTSPPSDGPSGCTDRLQTSINDRPVKQNLYYLISSSCSTRSKRCKCNAVLISAGACSRI